MLNIRVCIISCVTMTRKHITMHANAVARSSFADYYVISVTDDLNFGTYWDLFVQISLTSTSRRAVVSHDVLAKCSDIQPICVKAMVQQTT